METFEISNAAYGAGYKVIAHPESIVARSLKRGEPYEAKVLYHIYRMGLRGGVVDIGAGIGNHTLWFARACAFDAVYSFEPIEYGQLMDNLKLNNLDWMRHNGDKPEMHAWPIALGSRACRAKSIGKGELAQSSDGEYPVSTLDEFRLSNISLIKIDVEGMEPEVLDGAEATILRCRPIIFAEAKDADAHEENAKRLQHLGYKHLRTFGATPLEEWHPC